MIATYQTLTNGKGMRVKSEKELSGRGIKFVSAGKYDLTWNTLANLKSKE